MTAPTAALSARQLKKVQDLVAPEASQGVLEFQNLCLGGVPLCTYTIGALKSLLLGDGSHLLVIGEMDTADSTLLSSLMTLESATSPTPELMTAIISRILSQIASGDVRPSPIPGDGPWSSATAVEVCNKDYKKAVPVGVLNGAPVASGVVQDGGPNANVIDSSQNSEQNAPAPEVIPLLFIPSTVGKGSLNCGFFLSSPTMCLSWVWAFGAPGSRGWLP